MKIKGFDINKHHEVLNIFYSPCYNTRVLYYGNNNTVIDFLRGFDIWNSSGEFSMEHIDTEDGMKSIQSECWKFECSKTFWTFCKTDDFAQYCKRKNIHLLIE